MVRAEGVKNISSSKNFFQSDDDTKFPIDDTHPGNFYSVTQATTNNGEYEVVDERSKSSDDFGGSLGNVAGKLFNTKLAHPFSASILKTTKSIAESQCPNGTCSSI